MEMYYRAHYIRSIDIGKRSNFTNFHERKISFFNVGWYGFSVIVSLLMIEYLFQDTRWKGIKITQLKRASTLEYAHGISVLRIFLETSYLVFVKTYLVFVKT